jgi:hypothetical protein
MEPMKKDPKQGQPKAGPNQVEKQALAKAVTTLAQKESRRVHIEPSPLEASLAWRRRRIENAGWGLNLAGVLLC